jgi:hypothetical protein
MTTAPVQANSCFADLKTSVATKYTQFVDKVATNFIDFRPTFATDATTGTIAKVVKAFGELLATLVCLPFAATLGIFNWVKGLCNCSESAKQTPPAVDPNAASTAAPTETAVTPTDVTQKE